MSLLKKLKINNDKKNNKNSFFRLILFFNYFKMGEKKFKIIMSVL